MLSYLTELSPGPMTTSARLALSELVLSDSFLEGDDYPYDPLRGLDHFLVYYQLVSQVRDAASPSIVLVQHSSARRDPCARVPPGPASVLMCPPLLTARPVWASIAWQCPAEGAQAWAFTVWFGRQGAEPREQANRVFGSARPGAQCCTKRPEDLRPGKRLARPGTFRPGFLCQAPWRLVSKQPRSAAAAGAGGKHE